MDPTMTIADASTAERVRISDRVVLFQTGRSPNWYCQYNADGRQHKPSLKTTNLKQARMLAKRLDAQLTLGMNPEQRKRSVTVELAVNKYLESQKVHIGAKTIVLYTRDLLQFAAFSSEERVTRLDAATAEHLEAFEARLRTKGPPRIRRYPKKNKPEEE